MIKDSLELPRGGLVFTFGEFCNITRNHRHLVQRIALSKSWGRLVSATFPCQSEEKGDLGQYRLDKLHWTACESIIRDAGVAGHDMWSIPRGFVLSDRTSKKIRRYLKYATKYDWWGMGPLYKEA